MDISSYAVPKAPPSVLYIPNFITEEEEENIIKQVYNAPKPKWTQLRNRRLQNWGGLPHSKGMITEDIPKWLQSTLTKVNELKLYDNGNLKANHVLINEYLPGQGIMAHTDGPLFYPTIITISCGTHTVLNFQKNIKINEEVAGQEAEKISLVLERRSLVAIMNSLYTDYLHSIDERNEDFLDDSIINISNTKFKEGDCLIRDTRISLTIRNVLKVSKFKLPFLIKK